MDHREVQLSNPNSLDTFVSYQQQQQTTTLGPGITKILEHERQRRDLHEGEEMKRRTRTLYVMLGVVLLCVYFTLVKKHFFEKHHISLPTLSEKEDITGAKSLRASDPMEFEESPHKKNSNRLPLFFHHGGTLCVLRESVLNEKTGKYNAIIEETRIQSDGYKTASACFVDFDFERDRQSFAGILTLRDTSNELVLLGLHHSSNSGLGLVAMKKMLEGDGSSCRWKSMRSLDTPPSAHFNGYSTAAIDMEGFVSISSQEDGAVWIGHLEGLDETTGLWDIDKLQFDEEGGHLLSFP